MLELNFHHLNPDWNAEPNAPEPTVSVIDRTVQLTFFLNPFAYDAEEEEIARLSFVDSSIWRLGSTNDEGWYRGQCRFSEIAPRWGEFYEIQGQVPLVHPGIEWHNLAESVRSDRHFLFYLRDHTFECRSRNWKFERGIERP